VRIQVELSSLAFGHVAWQVDCLLSIIAGVGSILYKCVEENLKRWCAIHIDIEKTPIGGSTLQPRQGLLGPEKFTFPIERFKASRHSLI